MRKLTVPLMPIFESKYRSVSLNWVQVSGMTSWQGVSLYFAQKPANSGGGGDGELVKLGVGVGKLRDRLIFDDAIFCFAD